MDIDGVAIKVVGGELSESEIRNYVKRGMTMRKNLKRIKLNVDGNNVEITYDHAAVPYERITRIK